jgi:glycosyltransferase involved in cell wall biosynthesis
MQRKYVSPKISVVMPVYNAEKYLDESIQSILNQSFVDFEFIIINDGSKDNTKNIIERYKKKDKRIILINNVKNLGLQISLNKGLKVARGKYIARMDADDISLKERFNIQVNYLESNPDIYLIGGSAIVIDEGGNKLGVFLKYDDIIRIAKKLRKVNCIIHPSIMFKNTREFFYREKFKTSEDYDLYLRILTSNKKMTNLPNILIKYRISKKSFVSTMPNQEYYFKKAQCFYYQRIKSKKDDYEDLSPPEKNSFPKNHEKYYLNLIIFIQLSDGQGKKVRRNIEAYFRKYGADRRLVLYYLLSFFPYKFIELARRFF